MSETPRTDACEVLCDCGANYVDSDVARNFERALTAERTARERAEANLLCPGQMRCAKCKFELTRRTLFVQSGTVGAGSSETEPCPNGCGPLWPVTWEQEARACYAAMDRLFDEKQRAEAERDALLARVRDDALAMTCQSIGQYRKALMAAAGVAKTQDSKEARRDAAERRSWLVDEYVAEYEYGDEGYVPTDDERAMLADFAHGLIAHLDAAIRAATRKP